MYEIVTLFTALRVYLNPPRPFSRLKMPPRAQFDQPQRVFLALEFHKRRGTRDFLPELLADFSAQFPGARVPSLNAIRKIHEKFILLGTINNVNSKNSPGASHSGRPKTSTSDQNKQRVKAVLDRDRVKEIGDNAVSPISSCRRNALALDKSAFWRLTKDLRYHPYKPVKRHELKPGDLPRRLAFCQWLVQLNDDELLQIVTSDEASFHLSTHVNSQNVRRYAPLKSSDPVNGGRPDHFAVDQPTFSPKLMVFCGMKRDGTFGLKFYRNENMTGASYHQLLQYDVLPQLRAWNGGNLDGIFWQQDGQRGFLFRTDFLVSRPMWFKTIR